MGVAVEVPSDSVETDHYQLGDDPKTTSFTFGAGSGSYGRNIHASRVISLGYDSCTGTESSYVVDANFKFKDDYHDYGAEIDHQVTNSLHVGARGGYIEEDALFLGSTLDASLVDSLFNEVRPETDWSQIYVNPFFSVEKQNWGFGLGFVYSDNHLWTGTEEYGDHDDDALFPTGHFRIGPLQKIYGDVSLWEGVPIYSGGGQWQVGFGVRPISWLELWGGMGFGGPYTREGFIVRGNLDMGRNFTLGTSFRFHEDATSEFGAEPPSEYGVSASLTYKILRD